MMRQAVLTPAYGRDYKSKAEVIRDLKAGKDFILVDMFSPWNGKPATAVDLAKDGYQQFSVRYKKMTQVVLIDVEGLGLKLEG